MSIFDQINLLFQQKVPFLVLLDFEIKQPILLKLSDLKDDILIDFPNYSNIKTHSNTIQRDFLWRIHPIPYNDYLLQFNQIKKEINLGNSYLCNLTCETKISTDLGLKDIFYASQAKYKCLYQDKFLFFSPETFIKIDHNKIYTFPMKGTIDASIPNAEYLILNNPKEKAEHHTIVDLLRNDLSRVADHVEVAKFRYIDKIKTYNKELYQISSEITGNILPVYQDKLGSVLEKILPVGSVTGAPKNKTVNILNKTETHNRHFFTGIMGIYDGGTFDSCVIIRYLENRDNQLYYKSGGGITHLSKPEEEYQEMLNKIYVPIY